MKEGRKVWRREGGRKEFAARKWEGSTTDIEKVDYKKTFPLLWLATKSTPILVANKGQEKINKDNYTFHQVYEIKTNLVFSSRTLFSIERKKDPNFGWKKQCHPQQPDRGHDVKCHRPAASSVWADGSPAKALMWCSSGPQHPVNLASFVTDIRTGRINNVEIYFLRNFYFLKAQFMHLVFYSVILTGYQITPDIVLSAVATELVLGDEQHET